MLVEHSTIKGLFLWRNYIDSTTQQTLMSDIDNELWDNTLSRRTQHYGYKYNYRSRNISKDDYLGELPDWLSSMLDDFVNNNVFEKKPEQLIVNEYKPGQGISEHIDSTAFGERIVSISLGSTCIMDFIHNPIVHGRCNTVNVVLNPGDLVLMTGESRYKWKHQIIARKTDMIDGKRQYRQRRVSLTFRNLNNYYNIIYS